MKILSRWRYVGSTAKWMKAELFWRDLRPRTKYDLDVGRHNELLQTGSQWGSHRKRSDLQIGHHHCVAGRLPIPYRVPDREV